MAKLGRPPVYLDIVEEHFDEMEFLWEHREANVFTRDWDLHDLAEHEERAEAHLDGLRLSELGAVDLAREKLTSGDTSAATAATFVLIETGEPEFRELVLEALRSGEQPIVDGVRIALRHGSIDEIRGALDEIMTSGAPISAVAAADVLAFHRLSVGDLTSFLDSDDPWARILGLGAAGRAGRLSEADLSSVLEHAEPSVRGIGLRESARRGLGGTHRHCLAAAMRNTDPDPVAVAFLGTLGEEEDLAVLRAAVQREELAISAVAGIGAMGYVSEVPLLIELMADDALGVAATAAYRRITGANDVEGDKPFPPPPVAEGEDEEEALPPDPDKTKADWNEREPLMSADHAWQSGIALEPTNLPERFNDLPLESRRDAHLRLRSQARGRDLELEALAVRQLEA